MSETSMVFIVPPALKEALPTLNRLRVIKMPARVRLAERVVRRDRLVMYKAKTGKIYCNSVANGAYLIFNSHNERMWKRAHLECLHALGELPDEEWELIQAFEEDILENRDLYQTLKWTIESIEKKGVEVPQELLDKRDAAADAMPDLEEWLNAYQDR